MYINDLEKICKVIKPTSFADDTNLLIATYKRENRQSEIQSELCDIVNYFKFNKVALNIPKSHCMPFKKNNCSRFSLGTQEIQVSDFVKYLGIYLDRNLKFTEHVDYLLKKLGKYLGIISKLRHFVARGVLFKYYNFYIKPVIQYGILVYGGNSLKNLDSLSVFQRKFVRLCVFKKRSANVEQDFIRNNVLTVTQLYFYELIKFVFRSLRKELPSDFLNLFEVVNLRTNSWPICSSRR